jgi:hypothetical protein
MTIGAFQIISNVSYIGRQPTNSILISKKHWEQNSLS